MKTALRRALVAALLLSAGCSLTVDPNSVEAPKAKNVTPHGACVTSTAHKLCDGQISPGTARMSSAGHKVQPDDVGNRPRGVGTFTANLSSSQHKIVGGDVSP